MNSPEQTFNTDKLSPLFIILMWIFAIALAFIPIINILLILNIISWMICSRENEYFDMFRAMFWTVIVIVITVFMVIPPLVVNYSKYLYQLGDEKKFNFNSPASNSAIDETIKNLEAISTALDMYYTKNLSYPENLSALVPEFIDNIPIDPLTKKQYIYVIDERDGYEISVPEPSAYGYSEIKRYKDKKVQKK